jgi:hypothetical protein
MAHQDDITRQIESTNATSEVRWTRAQHFFQNLQNETDEQERELVEEPLSPSSVNSSSGAAPNDVETLGDITEEKLQSSRDYSKVSYARTSVEFEIATALSNFVFESTTNRRAR